MIIRTFDGSAAKLSKCRKIKGEYYEINRQCFFMSDDRWHRINNGRIFYDHELKKWLFNNESIAINGIIGFNGTMPILGKFTKNPLKNHELFYNEERYTVIDESIIDKRIYREKLSNGVWYQKTTIPQGNAIKKGIGNRYSIQLQYRCGYRLEEFTKHYDVYNEKVRNAKNGYIEQLPDVSYGIEIETFNGFIPERECFKHGMIPVKDGSLRKPGRLPFEYASVILSGYKGLNTIRNQCNLLDKYCEKSISESLHIHIGGIPVTKEYVTAIYVLGNLIEDEIYSMFPKHFKNTGIFKPTRQGYCNPLKKLKLTSNTDENFDTIYDFLSGRSSNSDVEEFDGFGKGHPYDRSGTSKWHVGTRYVWLNLVPLIFSQGTVEFRVHSQTFNSDKIINWVFITSAICKFAEKYSKQLATNKINSVNLSNIFSNIYEGRLIEYLSKYVEYRKELMVEHSERHNDNIGTLDIINDNLDNFKYPIKSIMR